MPRERRQRHGAAANADGLANAYHAGRCDGYLDIELGRPCRIGVDFLPCLGERVAFLDKNKGG